MFDRIPLCIDALDHPIYLGDVLFNISDYSTRQMCIVCRFVNDKIGVISLYALLTRSTRNLKDLISYVPTYGTAYKYINVTSFISDDKMYELTKFDKVEGVEGSLRFEICRQVENAIRLNES